MFTPSQRQQDIFDVWSKTDNNVLVNAVAGSGKTTLLMYLLERFCLNESTLFLAFNKSIQQEIQERIEDRQIMKAEAKTMHSLGLLAINQHYEKVFVKSGNQKNFTLVQKVQKENPGVFKYMKWKDKLSLSFSLMDMNDVSRLFLTDDLESINRHLLSMDKILSKHSSMKKLWACMLKHRNLSYTQKTVEVDFTDMIYLPVLKDMELPVRAKYLFMDEVQDFNLCQHRLIDKLLSQGTVSKWVAVGDRNQAIYGFSGAFSSSFDKFLTKPGKVLEMPLDICYRCDIDIVDCANEVYDVMEPFSKLNGVVKNITDITSIEDNSMVICRNTAPLVDLYFQLLSIEKSCYIKGKDILANILKFIKPYRKLKVKITIMEMQAELSELSKKPKDSYGLETYILKQNLNTFISISNSLGAPDSLVLDLEDKIKGIFVDKANSITLSTIHKSKGLESDVVYILNEDLIPAKFATSPEQLVQEENLRYVARTRAKHKLYFLTI